ncbi:hypothetical protein EVAR_5721_1 [Eumeta japonica]|uniref:Uncharacterized protein n=1 Tax=Eumeta variegata TaxID=151549 RepID=A0A4C1TAT7_EUMVA|nr:hypothetical protein EVAR_5721_1 [Eumeta japonica]
MPPCRIVTNRSETDAHYKPALQEEVSGPAPAKGAGYNLISEGTAWTPAPRSPQYRPPRRPNGRLSKASDHRRGDDHSPNVFPELRNEGF